MRVPKPLPVTPAAMPIDRREFLLLGASAAALSVAPLALRARPLARHGIQAILFDAFPIFDTRSITALAEHLFPDQGAALIAAWRTRQFEYQWLRALSNRYADFWQLTGDSLAFACASLRLALNDDARRQLMEAHRRLKAWPDVPDALQTLRQAGLRLGFLSNMTRDMLDANIRSAGLEGQFEHVLSSDQVGSYKPDPRAYRIGLDALGLQRSQILFAAFAGWDAAGAKAFGYPCFWVNRMQAPREELGVTPDATGHDLNELASFVMRTG